MWKKILLGLGAVISGIIGLAAIQPNTFRIERSITIDAPPETVFGIVSDLHNGKDWSPWEQLDPQMHKTFAGPESGVGSTLAWAGNKDVGRGSQKIVAARAPNQLVTELHFIEPFEAVNEAEFLIRDEGAKSHVIWAMYGPMNFVSKVMCLFVSMDKMVGKDFETGLANLKKLAESKPPTIIEPPR